MYLLLVARNSRFVAFCLFTLPRFFMLRSRESVIVRETPQAKMRVENKSNLVSSQVEDATKLESKYFTSTAPSSPLPDLVGPLSGSEGTNESYTSSSNSSSHHQHHQKHVHYKNLRQSLTREQRNRDPLYFYDVIKVLGKGSMGSVRLVKKKRDKIGGSSRPSFQKDAMKQQRDQTLLNIPLIGGLFRCCFDGTLQDTKKKRFSIFLLEDPSSSLSFSIWNRNRKDSDTSLLTEATAATSTLTSTSTSQSEIIYAMKSIVLSQVSNQNYIKEMRNEIQLLKTLDHPHIVRAIETFEQNKEIFIVMEVCSGGDLYCRDPYTESEAARIVSSILSAISYMHSKNITHRDLKFENVMFVNSSPKSEIKLIDFGLSKKYGPSEYLTEGVGTIYTMAPEVLKGKYTEKADIWSIGVITYMLLSSQLPFYGKDRKCVVQKILNGKYNCKGGRRWRRVSQQAKEFVQELLAVYPDQRPDADTVIRSAWLHRNNYLAATTRDPDAQEELSARSSMIRYAGYSQIKKMALMVVAHKSTSEEIGILRKVFQKFDSRRDGSITFPEFVQAMQEGGFGGGSDDGNSASITLSQNDLKSMFESLDLDGTGRILYTEFIAATIEAHGVISEERLAEAFDRLDSDDSGYVSAGNLIEILGDEIPREQIDEIISEADTTNDKKISYGEFLSLWEQKREIDKEDQWKLLGSEVHQTMTSLQTNVSNLTDTSIIQDDDYVAAAHIRFLQEKYDNISKHRNTTR